MTEKDKQNLEELLSSIEETFAGFMTSAKKQIEKGNKAAGTRARVSSMDLRNLLKEFKAQSTEADKK